MNNTKSPDLLIVGAGIFGLWAARHAIKAGRKVLVCEKRTVGAGASGGFLGALMPHMPDAWNPKKQMQYEALVTLPEFIWELEADTGMDCGFRRCGRLMPLVHEKMPENAGRRVAGAQIHWARSDTSPGFEMRLLHPPFMDGLPVNWLNEDLCPYGATWDNLSARINPRAYLRALEHYVRQNAVILEQVEVVELLPEEGAVQLADGSRLSAEEILIASGHEAYSLLQSLMGPLNDNRPIGRGVKGQAIMVEFNHHDELPIVYHDGAYVVPHTNNRVAIGSTSRNDWQGPANAFDESDLDFYHKALELVPALSQAPILERWANVRPRNTLGSPWTLTSGTDPYVGPIPGLDRVSVAIGGFKIGLGIAHWITKLAQFHR